MSFEQPYGAPDLRHQVWRWLAHNPGWSTRPAPPDGHDQFTAFYISSYRAATADEVATDILGNPALRETLGFLASPRGQAIEQVVAQLWLSGWEAELLTAGLTRAWKIVLNQNRPVWQRTEVLAGAGVGVGVLGLMIWASRRAA
jgi:hypothetical protein